MVNVKKLRCFIGWLAIMLPFVVVAILGYIPDSISSTYYTRAGASFMMILGAASILLMFYDGYDKVDDVVNTTAGIFGILICLFPCYTSTASNVGTFAIPVNASLVVHNASAVCFFALLSYMSLFQFTKTNGNITKKKKARNVIYRICGVGMLGAFALFALPDFYSKIWLIETIALSFFGISWLTKANAYKWLFAEGENGT